MNIEEYTVTVVGLGYVGLPLAVALAKRFKTVGLDVDLSRVNELASGHDRTGEIASHELKQSRLVMTASAADCPPSDFYIVTVPTPIDRANKPDLRMIEAASETVGSLLSASVASGRTPIVVFESTVYPGVTEDLCAPILERASGHQCGSDFFVGYSPERINPGDREHTVDKITKVVAGQNADVLERLADLYGSITSGGVFRAASIKAAEAAKVIENAQRDINIAFMNEVTQIFAKMGLSVWDVLEAARTKWNFLPFSPGLVGGHCIGVDPYYLAYRSEELGHEPRVILAGRTINDSMADWVAERLDAAQARSGGSALVLGLTFKEDVPDLRNSKVADLIEGLRSRGYEISVHDPHADPAEAKGEYGLTLDPDAMKRKYDLVVLAVAHREYLSLGAEELRKMVADRGLLADLRGVLGSAADWRL